MGSRPLWIAATLLAAVIAPAAGAATPSEDAPVLAAGPVEGFLNIKIDGAQDMACQAAGTTELTIHPSDGSAEIRGLFASEPFQDCLLMLPNPFFPLSVPFMPFTLDSSFEEGACQGGHLENITCSETDVDPCCTEKNLGLGADGMLEYESHSDGDDVEIKFSMTGRLVRT